jgi:hypothetical protein
MEYVYNIVAVDKKGIAIKVLWSGNFLPNWYQEMIIKNDNKWFCDCCEQEIIYKTVILAGEIKIGSQIIKSK